METLVVYFSRKGYVKRIAEQKAAESGADIFALETTEPTRGVLAFWWCGRFGMHRWGMPLKALPDARAYEKVIICSPIWVFDICAPVREFIEKSAGKVKNVEYVFVHFSLPARYERTAARIDKALGVARSRYESIACCWGREIYRKSFENQNSSGLK